MQTYTQAVEETCCQVRQIAVTSPEHYYPFAAFSANLGLFLPHIPVSRHPELFRQTLLNQRLANLDEYYLPQLQIHWAPGCELDFDRLRSSPAIVCTYHTGSYRLLSYLLMEQHISIALLLASKVIQEQGEGMRAHATKIGKRNGTTCTLIDAEQPMAGLHILKALRQGTTVVAYIDGNTGALANGENANLTTVRFLDKEMRVRVGLPQLARRAGAILCGVMALRNPDYTPLMTCTRFVPPNHLGEEGCNADQHAMQLFYADLEKAVKGDPWLWENWFYLHEQLNWHSL